MSKQGWKSYFPDGEGIKIIVHHLISSVFLAVAIYALLGAITLLIWVFGSLGLANAQLGSDLVAEVNLFAKLVLCIFVAFSGLYLVTEFLGSLILKVLNKIEEVKNGRGKAG